MGVLPLPRREPGERVGERGLSAHTVSVGLMARLSPLEFRRLLRKKATDAEHELWSRLRRHRMGPKFRRQHTAGPYTLDFYCPAAKLAIELDGGRNNFV